MAPNYHISFFSVKNFKGFDFFEMNELGQFNLISGDNNVGKTSLLESLLLDNDLIQTLHNLNSIYWIKHNLSSEESRKRNYLDYFINNKSGNKSIHYSFAPGIEFRIDKGDVRLQSSEVVEKFHTKYSSLNKIGEIAMLFVNNKLQDVSPIEYLTESHLISGTILPNNIGFTSRMVKSYSFLINQDFTNKSKLIESLKLFIPDIQDIWMLENQFGENTIEIQQHNSNQLLPLTSFGDGALKMFRLILRIMTTSNQRLMIDEIDAGVFYLKMKEYIKVILLTAKQYNVQLFFTTHSKEFIDNYYLAISDLGVSVQSLSRFIRLEKQQSGRVVARNYSYQQFSNAIELGNEVRY
ncbi:MAG: AAA family ATPase [Bacteroidia bacterium]|jgi:AAA15 family ATPase/GTPase|nr:AAA family ATPase [Bacteroidia bacterium]